MKKVRFIIIVSLMISICFLSACETIVADTYYVVTFDSNGGSALEPFSTYSNKEETPPNPPTKEGFNFGGWYIDNNTFTQEFNFNFKEKPLIKNITIYAKWLPQSYTITFEVNEGSAIDPISHDYLSEITAPISPTKTGYEFGGWYTDEALKNIYSFTTMPKENFTLYAKWNLKKCTVTFLSNGGSSIESIEMDYNTSATRPENPTRDYYNFVNWYSDSGLNYVYNFSNQITSNKTLYAKWSAINYNITYNLNGGINNQNNPASYNINTSTISLLNPSYVGHTFEGWYTEGNFENSKTGINKGSYGELTLFAKWRVNKYSVYFVENGGSNVPDITGDYNSNIVKPTDPTMTGFSFAGWYRDIQLSIPYVFAKMPSENSTVYAKWNINQYTIFFEENCSSEIPNIVQDYNSSVLAPIPPTRVEYSFAGWYADSQLNNPYTFNTIPAHNTTVYLKWAVKQFTISFEEKGGSEVSNITQDYNTTILKPANPTRVGYNFDDWYIDNQCTEKFVFDKMPSSNITLYAGWIINQVTLFFEENGGSIVPDVVQNYNSTIYRPSDPSRSNYYFIGWFKDVALTKAFEFTTMPSTNITAYAKWLAIDYTITYYLKDGTNHTSNPANYNIETNTFEIQAPTKVGHTFSGWYNENTYSTLADTVIEKGSVGNIVLYAKWTINKYTITFLSNGGSSVTAITQDYNSIVVKPNDPTKDGYTFNKWCRNEALTMTYTFSTMEAENVTLYAKWTLKDYAITYNLDGGTNNANNPNTYTIETDNIVLSSPTKNGFTFGGWYSDSELSIQVTSINKGSFGNKDFYAKWI